MPIADVINKTGEKVTTIELADEVWAVEVNDHLLWEVVRWQMAKRRAGTHSTKTVSHVRGGGKKPFKQKGTGRARQGSIRSSNMVGGGRAFGPHPRDYDYSLPKKVRKGALRSALSLRMRDKKVIILENFQLEAGDEKRKRLTHQVNSVLEKLSPGKTLVIDVEDNRWLWLGTRNLKKARWLPPNGVNVYDVLNHDTMMLTVPSVSALEAALK